MHNSTTVNHINQKNICSQVYGKILIKLPKPHNPALPQERQGLAAEVLRTGSALILTVSTPVAIQAEMDAEYLCLVHGSQKKALGIIANQEEWAICTNSKLGRLA